MSGCNNNIRYELNLHLNELNTDGAVSITLPNNFSEDSEDEQLDYRCIPTCPELEYTSNILVSAIYQWQPALFFFSNTLRRYINMQDIF